MTDFLKTAMSTSKAREEVRKKIQLNQDLDAGDAALVEELRKLDDLYTQAVAYARSFMTAVRLGKSFDYNEATPMVDSFIESVFRNEAAAAAICKLKAFDEYTYTHCINVSVLAVILGRRLGLDRETLKILGMAGVFHDVGKAVMPSKVLNKPGKLTEAEMDIMRTHPERGFHILDQQEDMPDAVLRVCLEHHERVDGSGYPRGIKGEALGELSRIVAVVDVYDALTSKRVYKDALPPAKVLAMMYKWREEHYYPGVLEQFIKCLGVYPVGSLVRLSSGDHGVVLAQNEDTPLHPVVRVVFDEKFRHKTPAFRLDLADQKEDAQEVVEVLNPAERNIDVYRLLQ